MTNSRAVNKEVFLRSASAIFQAHGLSPAEISLLFQSDPIPTFRMLNARRQLDDLIRSAAPTDRDAARLREALREYVQGLVATG